MGGTAQAAGCEVRVPGVDAQFEALGQGRDEAVTGRQRDSLPSELGKNAGRLNEVARFLRLVFPDRHFFLQSRKCLRIPAALEYFLLDLSTNNNPTGLHQSAQSAHGLFLSIEKVDPYGRIHHDSTAFA